jgi:putative ABC transport system permease protein
MNWRPDLHDREVEEELRFHLEMEAEKNRAAGMSEDDARRAARRSFGGVRRVQEEIRDLRRTRAVELLLRDLAYGWRSLRRAPAYALTTIVTLGLAVGVFAAMLTFIEGALLRPLPHREPERVVTLWETNLASGETQLAVSPANFLDWQQRTTVFESFGLVSDHGLDIRRGDRVESIPAGRISLDYFRTLGIAPVAGRLFEPRDFDRGAEPGVILTRRFWVEAFGGDRALIGRTIEVDGKPARVLGVVPDHADHAAVYGVYAPLQLYPGEKTSRSGHWMYAAARLRPGVTHTQARGDLTRVAEMIARENPQTNEALRVRAIPLRETVLGRTQRLLLALGLGSLFLLVLACANVAALALARGAARRRELAIRVSLGASLGRIVRQLATESAMLNAAAAVLAWIVAAGVVVWMSSNAPAGLRRLDDVNTGAFTLGATLVIALFSTLLSGVLPAFRLARLGLSRDLEGTRRAAGLSRGEARLQGGLVVAQIALALLLLTGAGLLTRSIQKLTANDLGFDPHGVATIQMYLYDTHPDRNERVSFVRTSLDAMRAMPGVVAAGASSSLPFNPATEARDEFEILGRPRRAGESLTMFTTAITPGYLETMSMRVVEGRGFTEKDDASSPLVAIVNEAAARRFWNASPLGTKVRTGIMGPPREWTVVGVVGDTRKSDYAQEPRPEIFVPVAQGGSRVGGLNYVARTTTSARPLVDAMQRKIWELTPSQAISEADTMSKLVARSLQTQRFALLMISGFGVVALLLSSTGLFGMLSYVAARRRTEVGVRMALGATPKTIRALFLRRGMTLAALGVAAGLVVSAWFTRMLATFLYDTSSFDLVALGGVTATTVLVALLASWLPARKIAALDPNSVLRAE